MLPSLLLLPLFASIPQLISGTCYLSKTSSIPRNIVSVIPTISQVGCQILCTADINCQATMLNSAHTACVLLEAEISEPTSISCAAPYTTYVKTTNGCVDVPQGPISSNYSSGECSQQSDVVRDLAIDQSSPMCGLPTSSAQRRMVIDSIQHDGKHVVFENYVSGRAVWDLEVGSWYIDLMDGPVKYYFLSAKCVIAPISPLTPNCDCATLPTRPADSGNVLASPSTPRIDYEPACASRKLQFTYLRVTDSSRTWSTSGRPITCTMGVWMVITTRYNAYTLAAATCVK